MSRHRSVRGMNYDDDYDGYDDVYGHSVEDDYAYGVSPSTAAEFMYGGSHRGHQLSSFLENIGEEENDDRLGMQEPLADSGSFQKPQLSESDEVRLQSCLDEIRSIVGETVPEHVIVTKILESDFGFETALDGVLNYQDQETERRQKEKPGNFATSRNIAAPNTGLEDPLQKRLKEESAADLSRGVAEMSFAGQSEAKVGFEVKEPPKVRVQEVATPAGAMSPDRRGSMPKVNSSSDLSVLTSTPTRKESKTKPLDIDILKEYSERQGGKELLNMVVIGHVDAGKSTLMGHLLFLLGQVNKRTMHKYETESKKQGKASFAYAWVLDETGEERERGITMDVGLTKFETEHRIVTLLDAPGHKDFIPNMISGAAQADVAILVVDATRGEFETGFESGGQTREHAILARSLGVTQLAVAVNKMDTVDWSEERFNEIVGKLKAFLKKTGFKDSEVVYIPCSGLGGENLVKRADNKELSQWYKGPCLLEQIDVLKAPPRPIDKPFRMCVSDVFKGIGAGISVCGKIESGSVVIGDKIFAMPSVERGIIKGISVHEEDAKWACAGDQSVLVITGIDQNKVNVGDVLCSRTDPIKTTTRFQARIIVFDIEVPITKGFLVLLHYQAVSEPAVIKKLISTLHKSTGEVLQKKPKCLTKNSNAVVEIETSRPICIELYKDHKDLGRFMLRYSGSTIAAGLVTQIKES